MFRCSQTLTVVNRTHNARTDEITVYPHVFVGCSLYANHATAKEGNTARADAPTHKARLPLSACPGFVPPDQWAELSAAKKAESWTLNAETTIVPGGVADLKTWAQVQALWNKWTVTSWRDWTDTAFPHYAVEGS